MNNSYWLVEEINFSAKLYLWQIQTTKHVNTNITLIRAPCLCMQTLLLADLTLSDFTQKCNQILNHFLNSTGFYGKTSMSELMFFCFCYLASLAAFCNNPFMTSVEQACSHSFCVTPELLQTSCCKQCVTNNLRCVGHRNWMPFVGKGSTIVITPYRAPPSERFKCMNRLISNILWWDNHLNEICKILSNYQTKF